MNFTSIILYKKLYKHVLEEGIDPQAIAHLPSLDQLGPDTQAVPADQFFELHEIGDKHLGPGCSVRVGQKMLMDDYGVLGLSWKTCSKAGELFERSERYFILLSNTYVIQVSREGNFSHIHLNRDTYRRGVRLSNEATFSATVVVLRAITEKNITPLQVSFQHAAPPDLSSYQDAYECPLLFDQPSYFMTYKTADLETRTAKADKSINAYFLERLEEEKKGLEIHPNRLANHVRDLIRDALPSGIPSIAQLGEHLGMSTRTLTRRLSESGISFRELVQKTQEEISQELLKNTSQSIGEIAFLTGFSEQSAFNRAFKRWTGQSPLEYRKN